MFARIAVLAAASAVLLSGCSAYTVGYFKSNKAKPVISEKLNEELSGNKAVLEWAGKTMSVTFNALGQVDGMNNYQWYTVNNKLCFREAGQSGVCNVVYQEGHSLFLFNDKSRELSGKIVF